MNLSTYIANYLQENNSVELSDFGVLTLHTTSAKLDVEQGKMMPPKQEFIFEEKQDVYNNSLAKFIAEKSSENLFVVQFKIKEEVAKWKEELQKKGKIHLPNLGDFTATEEGIKLISSPNLEVKSDFFGLEEIQLKKLNSEAKITSKHKNNNKSYTFNNSILWIFLLIVPILGLIYLGITNQEKLFGKKSVWDFSVKNATHRIEPTSPATSQKQVVDSLKINSLKMKKVTTEKTTVTTNNTQEITPKNGTEQKTK
mgnify:CR=1 FL=1